MVGIGSGHKAERASFPQKLIMLRFLREKHFDLQLETQTCCVESESGKKCSQKGLTGRRVSSGLTDD